ncbi:MAG: ATP-dependent DNA helicase RecG [Elusimicrobia bacterium]|nr:ATP-dependent DNA helicase RecG [Elusimicrobiota bacterium]
MPGSPMEETLQRSVRYLRGVGPKRAALFERLGIASLGDILFHFPRDWENRAETAPGPTGGNGPVVFRGRVLSARAVPTRSSLAIYKASLSVPAWQETIEAVWFKRNSYRYDVFKKLKSEVRPGADLWIVGRAEPSLVRVKECRVEEYYFIEDTRANIHIGRWTPVYPSTEGLSQPFLRERVAGALAMADQAVDILPASLRQHRRLLAISQALRGIHFPRSRVELEESRRRLAYEELLLLDLAWILKQGQTRAAEKSHRYELRRSLLAPFRRQLGFELTAAQKRVINEIFTDMQSPHPMTRLLQGDVGSGKTVVAIAAMLLAVENNYQAAFMAPTEILAEQHHWTLSRFLDGLPVRTRLLTSRVARQTRLRTLDALGAGRVDILIGTHALLEDAVKFPRLRLAVIDEQHRFGVRQRATLRNKNSPVDLLVMTATPIPRTLALALYGDLSVSTLDEMPPGRAATATHRGSEAQALERVREQVVIGRQAFIVYPIISESERLDLKAAQVEFERLRQGALSGLRTELLHGRMPGRRKAEVMSRFVGGQIDVLVATSVVEVGMDVPNAAVMVVQNADRFGLASLHQLRGRIGRSRHACECWLVATPQTPQARRRLEILCETTDGFRIGEEDLRLRGPGEILGVTQHGDLTLRIANLVSDADLQAQAHEDARNILSRDSRLAASGNRLLRQRLLDLYQKQWGLIDLA